MTNQTQGLAQYLTFSVADEEYGVSVLSVREILEYGVVTRVPRAPAHIRGVMNLRGRVVPLVDLAARLGLAPRAVTPRTCVVVVEVELESERAVLGLVVDAVSRVIELGDQDIEAPPLFGANVDVALLSGMGRAGKRFILLLDVEKILSDGSLETGPRKGKGAEARPVPSRASGFLGGATAALIALASFL